MTFTARHPARPARPRPRAPAPRGRAARAAAAARPGGRRPGPATPPETGHRDPPRPMPDADRVAELERRDGPVAGREVDERHVAAHQLVPAVTIAVEGEAADPRAVPRPSRRHATDDEQAPDRARAGRRRDRRGASRRSSGSSIVPIGPRSAGVVDGQLGRARAGGPCPRSRARRRGRARRRTRRPPTMVTSGARHRGDVGLRATRRERGRTRRRQAQAGALARGVGPWLARAGRGGGRPCDAGRGCRWSRRGRRRRAASSIVTAARAPPAPCGRRRRPGPDRRRRARPSPGGRRRGRSR